MGMCYFKYDLWSVTLKKKNYVKRFGVLLMFQYVTRYVATKINNIFALEEWNPTTLKDYRKFQLLITCEIY